MTTEYTNFFKGWNVKILGRKPTDDELKAAHAFGRPGKQSLALAMAMREDGVTAAQVIVACGAPQNNHRVAVIKKGYFKREAAPITEAGHTVYKITMTSKGTNKVKMAETAEQPKEKAKKQPKAKKQAPAATDTPVEQPTA